MNAENGKIRPPLNVIVVGGGIAAAEALLALRSLAGDRVALTLVSPGDELRLPALTVAEPFAAGLAPSVSLDGLAAHAGARLVRAELVRVDDARRRIVLAGGYELGYDALLLAVGARPVARVDHALTWWPGERDEALSGLLRDLEEGYTKRVAFVIPAGPVWPVALYELALLTARQVSGMGMDDIELTLITPDAIPLSFLGAEAGAAARDELFAAGVRLQTASVVRVERGDQLRIVLQPSARRITVERIVALPGLAGPALAGTVHDEHGFISVEASGRMRGSAAVWAAGDAVAYPVKYGGLAARQADEAAASIAERAGAPAPAGRIWAPLNGVLMTGERPRLLRHRSGSMAAAAPGKAAGTFLVPFLAQVAGDGIHALAP